MNSKIVGDNIMIKTKDLYFRRSTGEFILLVDSIEEDDVQLIINEFLKQHNFTSYYTRTWTVGEQKWYDVGSHTEFFVWTSDNLINTSTATRENGDFQ